MSVRWSRPLSATEVADMLRMSKAGVVGIPAAELPFYRVGSRGDRRYDIADVRRYIAARREDGRPRLEVAS